MSRIRRCDKCKKDIIHPALGYDITYDPIDQYGRMISSSSHLLHFDLCEVCKCEFLKFMGIDENKTI